MMKAYAPLIAIAFAQLVIYCYKDYLYDLSIEHIKILRTEFYDHRVSVVASLFSELSDKYVNSVMVFLSYQLFSLTNSFLYTTQVFY